jgi:hypothetical protein
VDAVNHPGHYGGKDDPYEAIKVIIAWRLGFCLGNAIKYIRRAGQKMADPEPTDTTSSVDRYKRGQLQDLKKARFYLDYEIGLLEKEMKEGE